MQTTTRIAGAAAGLALALGTFGTPSAVADKPAPCTQQQKQVDKAQAALGRVTAVLQHQQDKVQKAKHQAKAADTAAERAHAQRHVSQAKDAHAHAKKAKTAQLQRLTKAQGRLSACMADQPTDR